MGATVGHGDLFRRARVHAPLHHHRDGMAKQPCRAAVGAADPAGVLHNLYGRVNIAVTLTAIASLCINQERPFMSDNVVGIAGDRIRSIVERIEHIEEEIKGLTEGKKEIFLEAKGEGFDVKVIKEILRLRKQDKDERDEHESLLDLYLSAMESSEKEPAKAA
jgi:uncharacterized protein (UPF0335 family)